MVRALRPFVFGANSIPAVAATAAQTDYPPIAVGERSRARGGIESGVMGGTAPAMMDPDMMARMSPDVMGDCGIESGMAGGHGTWAEGRLPLSDEQRAVAQQITGTMRKQHWELRGKIMEGQNRLSGLVQEQPPDPKAVGAIYLVLCKLQQQMLETYLQARIEILAILTPEQREQAEQRRLFERELESERELERNGRGYRRGMTPR